jgi:hypothetical protein
VFAAFLCSSSQAVLSALCGTEELGHSVGNTIA